MYDYYAFKNAEINIVPDQNVDIQNIYEALKIFFAGNQLEQITFVLKESQLDKFKEIMESFAMTHLYFFKNENKKTMCADIQYFNIESFLKHFQLLKDSHKIFVSFYGSEQDPNVGYWTFVKGNKHDAR